MGAPGPVLAVLAHPDDETMLAGGLLALAAERGARVVVVTATRGERGEMIGGRSLEGTDAVPMIRGRERATALAALGVREHHFLDELRYLAPDAGGGDAGDDSGVEARWTDSGMTWVGPGLAGPAPDAPASALTSGDLEAQALTLAAVVREVRPTVLVSDEEGGSYGHPDHRRTHQIVVRALDLLQAAGALLPVHAVVTLAHDRWRAANTAVTAQIELEQPRGASAQLLLPPDVDPPALVRPAVDLEVDTSAVAARVLAALRAYPSQVQGATIPLLEAASGAAARSGSRVATPLRADQAAVGWYALSNDIAQPILPTVGLTAGRGGVDRLRAALAWAPAASAGPAAPVAGDADPSELGPPATQPLMTPPSASRVAGVAACLVLGVVVGLTATVVHRWRLSDLPLGMVLAILTVTVGALTARAYGRGAGLLAFAGGAVASVQALAFVATGGDVLVPGDALGMTWLLGSVLAIGVAAFLPSRWVGQG